MLLEQAKQREALSCEIQRHIDSADAVLRAVDGDADDADTEQEKESQS